MGQRHPVCGLLPLQPSTRKSSGDGISLLGKLLWGHSCMQGWREAMEDTHIAKPSLLPSTAGDGWGETALFAVMDGHGGDQVARFCELHLPGLIARSPCKDVAGAMRAAFLRMDEMLADPRNLPVLRALSTGHAKEQEIDPRMIGCTAVACCICLDKIVVANAGDSRAVLCRQGRAVDLSEDHKPHVPAEHRRIVEAGGCVLEQRCGPHVVRRVNGDLSLSRAIGDLRYKQNAGLPPEAQIVCSDPDVKTFPRHADDEFMVLACDGVWDVLSSQEVVDFIHLRLQDMLDGRIRPSAVLEELLDNCLAVDPEATHGIGGDNMTVVLVLFSETLPVLPLKTETPIERLPSLLLGCAPCSRKSYGWA